MAWEGVRMVRVIFLRELELMKAQINAKFLLN